MQVSSQFSREFIAPRENDVELLRLIVAVVLAANVKSGVSRCCYLLHSPLVADVDMLFQLLLLVGPILSLFNCNWLLHLTATIVVRRNGCCYRCQY